MLKQSGRPVEPVGRSLFPRNAIPGGTAMPLQVVVQGTLKPDGTLELAEKPNLPPGPVQVTLQVVPEPKPSGPGWWDVLQQIKQDQAARGYKGSTKEEIDAWINELR